MPMSLGDILHTPPSQPKPVRRGFSGIQAAAVVAVVVLLFAGAVGVPFLLHGAGPGPKASPTTNEMALTGLGETPSADASQGIGEIPSDMPSDAPPIDSTPETTPAPGDTGSAWWTSIVINWLDDVQSGGEGWVEVITRGPTQCELIIYYTPSLQQNLGTFGAPSNSPRRRTFTAPDTFTGTAHPKVTCWRDGPQTGPKHAWTLSVNVTQAATPTPSWTLTATGHDALPGASLAIVYKATASVSCAVTVTLPDGTVSKQPSTPTPGNVNETYSVQLAADAKTGVAIYTVSCDDAGGLSRTVSGTAKVLKPATPPPATPPPTATPTATAASPAEQITPA
jgi:hypothetical protein